MTSPSGLAYMPSKDGGIASEIAKLEDSESVAS